MDRDTLLQLLLQAEQHLALSKRQIDNQYRVIAKLEGGGHDTTAAVTLLQQFIETQEYIEDDRDRLKSRLSAAS